MSPSADSYGVHTRRIAGSDGIGAVCSSCARNAVITGSPASAGSLHGARFGTTWRAFTARTVAAASPARYAITANAAVLSRARDDISTPSAPRNGAARSPVALTTGRVVTCHGTSAAMSPRNHGPDSAIAAIPWLNRL